MKLLMNVSTNAYDLRRYNANAELKALYKSLGLNGVEAYLLDADEQGILQPEDVAGVHLRYAASWMDVWLEDEARILREYGGMDTCAALFGGTGRRAIVEGYRRNLREAAALEPEYLVFHVSECTIEESMKRVFHYTDGQVVRAAAALIGEIEWDIRSIPGQPWLLFENLWYAGLTMLRPDITHQMLASVGYPKAGVMLDVGHLLHTNPNLCNLDEAVDYIHAVLDRYGDLGFIKGIHLHQTLNGGHAQRLMQSWTPTEGAYEVRFGNVLADIFAIDAHQPFKNSRIREVIDRVRPEFLVLEQMSATRAENEENLRIQMEYL